MLVGKKVVIVLILWVGLGMVDGFLNMILVVKVGYVGMYWDEKILKLVEYFVKLLSDIL